MRKLLFGLACVVAVGMTAWFSARPQPDQVKVRLRLVDAETSKGVAGIVRITRKNERKYLAIPGLFDRLRGLASTDETAGWYVVPAAGVETTLPAAELQVEALSGLETALARLAIDARKSKGEITVPLRFLFCPDSQSVAAGNTHLHLRNLTPEQSDEYLRQIPAADGLKLMFISYLERHKDDADYITNRYPIGDLKDLETTGVLFNNGEEHRHNFKAFGEGYGHVMFLDLKKLVKPVSIGPGITGGGFDDPPLRSGIDDARAQGATVIWCHNTMGYEDVPSALTGRLHALNVFDGSRTGKYEENYYRYLNIGLQLPISTGTDWFLYDFSRVYARYEGKLTVKCWLEAVKRGRCVATNGPLLTLKVNGRETGAVIDLARPEKLRIEASGLGRHDFQALQLIHNGKVIRTERARPRDGSFAVGFEHTLRVEGPAWFAVRIDSSTKNELGKPLYAHTSPVYVSMAGKSVFDVDEARALLRQVEEGQGVIRVQAQFSSPRASQAVLAIYDECIRELTERINARASAEKK